MAYISWPGNKAQLTEETGVSVNVTGETIEIIQAPANITRVKGEAPESIIAAFPAFTPSQSFYSAEYPSVSNPFMPQPTPDGRMAPALLTDDGITETVARVSKKVGGTSKASQKLRGHSCQSTSIWLTERSSTCGVRNSNTRAV